MTENKRYIDDGFEAIEDQSFTDTETDRTYYVDYFDEIVDLVNEQDKTIKELKEDLKKKFVPFAKADEDYTTVSTEEFIKILNENEQLKQELFESKKDYLIETYSDNPIRRDEKIQGLKEEFKERFGDVE